MTAMTNNELAIVWVAAPTVIATCLTWLLSRSDFTASRIKRTEALLKRLELVERLIRLKESKAIGATDLPWSRIETTLRGILVSLEHPGDRPLSAAELRALPWWRRAFLIYPIVTRNAQKARIGFYLFGFAGLNMSILLLLALFFGPRWVKDDYVFNGITAFGSALYLCIAIVSRASLMATERKMANQTS